jgi:hypothetical protein
MWIESQIPMQSRLAAEIIDEPFASLTYAAAPAI